VPSRQRGELKPGRLPLGHQRRGDRLGVILVHHSVDGVCGSEADLAVQLDNLRREPLPFSGGVVIIGVGQRIQSFVEEDLHVLGSEDLVLDGLHDEGVELVYEDGDAGAGAPVVAPRAAEVAPGVLPFAAAGNQGHAPSARAATEERCQDPVLADQQRVRAVAAPLLADAGPQLSLRQDASEGLVVNSGLVGIAAGDFASVDRVSAVDRILEDVVNVSRPPHARGNLTRVMRDGRRLYALAGQPLGDAPSPVLPFVGNTEDTLDDLEVLPGLLGHDELLATLDGDGLVTEAHRAVGPEALPRLGSLCTPHVGRQLFRVSLGQPRKDGTDELAHGLVAHVGLGE